MNEQERRYTVPDAIMEIRGRKFRFDAVMLFKTSASRAVHTLVVYEEMLLRTLGVKRDAKLLTAQYLGLCISGVYKQLRLLKQWVAEGRIEEIS